MRIGRYDIDKDSKLHLQFSIEVDGTSIGRHSGIGLWNESETTPAKLAKMCRQDYGCPFGHQACPFVHSAFKQMHPGENLSSCSSVTAQDWLEVLKVYWDDAEAERRKEEEHWLS